MVRVCGIDPGTGSWDFIGLEDGEVILDTSIPTKNVVLNPSLVIDVVKSVGNLDLVVAPSGYGLPITKIDELDEKKSFLLTLKREEERKLIGLNEVIELLIKEKVKGYFIPGIKHLPTVPKYRKVGKIDMGTSDKLCSAALALYEEARRLQRDYSEISFILVEMGSGFTAVIGLENGQIVDAVGGAEGGIGFLACGGLDAEVAYLLGRFDKNLLYTGGAAYIAGYEGLSPREFETMVERDERFKLAWEALIESAVKDVAAINVSVGGAPQILLSGKLSRFEKIQIELISRLSNFADVRVVKGFAKIAKEAAQGAALIADGLAGGANKILVDSLKIREATGTVLDYIYFKEIEELREKIGI
ncbi:MAG: DUF1464 family protein [Candidatus Jordarchaeum sp.]|uniref:DUF1464 family protein n=1 Tax=Candidatus Jordarchaeum sp. TaxID=2823881 RepID=UPI00404A354B